MLNQHKVRPIMEFYLGAKFYKIYDLLKENHNEYLQHHLVPLYVLIKPTYNFFFTKVSQLKNTKIINKFPQKYFRRKSPLYELRNDNPLSF